MAKIRPISRADLKDTYGKVNQPLSTTSVFDLNSVNSDQIFGSEERDSKNPRANLDIYYREGYISLAIPVLNFFLAGEGAEKFKIILKDDHIEDIANGRLCYEVSTGTVYNAETLPRDLIYSEDILIGGNYLRYLLNEFDVENAIKQELLRLVNAAFKSVYTGVPDDSDLGEVIDVGEGLELIGGYKFIPAFSVEPEVFEQLFMDEVKDYLQKTNPRLPYLLAMKNNRAAVTDQIMNYLFVLPKGFRPKFKNRQNPLTKAYDQVVKKNAELSQLLMQSRVTVDTVRTNYIELISQIKHLMLKNSNPRDKQYKALFEMLKGKEGFIRDKMQGGRIDYSGRSVIIVDPNMPVDTVGIPIDMAVELFQLEELKRYQSQSLNKSDLLKASNKALRMKLAENIMKNSYCIIGRQPTLYTLGLRGMKMVPVKGNAIVLNPLITPAFNADFDGDQMHVSVAIGDIAKKEVKQLMSVTNNIFLPRNGECHIAPRQELIHGLWKASTVVPGPNSRDVGFFGGEQGWITILEGVCNQTFEISDTASVDGIKGTVGELAIRACLPSDWRRVVLGVVPVKKVAGTNDKNMPVKEGFFKAMNGQIALESKRNFVDTTNKLVKLGFAITNIFPPSIPILGFPDVSDLIKEFKEKISEHEKYYREGFETESAYSAYFDEAYSEFEAKVSKKLKESIPATNGYMEMMASGARGSMSNIKQMFGVKGRVMKNESEAFNAIIENPMVKQLTGLEHFVTAYGGHQGLVDKSIQTYSPGYLSREMSHAASSLFISNKDCGTTDGILLDYKFLKQFVNASSLNGVDAVENNAVRKLFCEMTVGRFIAGTDKFIETSEQAKEVYDEYVAEVVNHKVIPKEGMRLRSPITCRKPCCVKCYGIDYSMNKMAVVGFPAGNIASQAIGEPATQLTMKNFQSGGVAGVTNLTSSFDTVKQYINLYNLRKSSEPLGYDFIAPVSGRIDTVSNGDGTKKLAIKQVNTKGEEINKLGSLKINIYEGIELKDYVEAGDSIQKIQGDLNISEVMRYRSVNYAQKYLATKVFAIFKNEVFVNLKHFEMLVASMTFQLCLRGNDYFKEGCYYTLQEYWGHDRTGCVFEKTMKGVGQVPTYRNDVFSTMFMQNIQEGLKKSILLSGKDDMKLPITRYSFGLNIGMGSDITGYLESRGE